jgi:hypothetical protein
MPSLNQYAQLCQADIDAAVSAKGKDLRTDGPWQCPGSIKTPMDAAATIHRRQSGLGVAALLSLPKGSPRVAASLVLARMGEVGGDGGGTASGFTDPTLGGGDRAYDPTAADAYDASAEAEAAPPQLWVLGHEGTAELGAALAEKLSLVQVSTQAALHWCIEGSPGAIDVGVEPCPTAADIALGEEELAAVHALFEDETLAKDEEGTALVSDVLAKAQAPPPSAEPEAEPEPEAEAAVEPEADAEAAVEPEADAEAEADPAAAEPAAVAAPPAHPWLVALLTPMATSEDERTSLASVVDARKAELLAAAEAQFAEQLGAVSTETQQTAVLSMLDSPEATFRGYVICDLETAGYAVSRPPLTVLTLTLSEADVAVRRGGQRLDPMQGKLYTRPELDVLEATLARLTAQAEAEAKAAEEAAAAAAARKAAWMDAKAEEAWDLEAAEAAYEEYLEEEAAKKEAEAEAAAAAAEAAAAEAAAAEKAEAEKAAAEKAAAEKAAAETAAAEELNAV